jgi:hypothetical protein
VRLGLWLKRVHLGVGMRTGVPKTGEDVLDVALNSLERNGVDPRRIAGRRDEIGVLRLKDSD